MREFQQHLLTQLPKHGGSLSFSIVVARVAATSALEAALTKVRKQAKAAGIAMRRKELEDLEAQSRKETSQGSEKSNQTADTAGEAISHARVEASGKVRTEARKGTFEEYTEEAETGEITEATAKASFEGRSRTSAEVVTDVKRKDAVLNLQETSHLRFSNFSPENSHSRMPLEMPNHALVPAIFSSECPRLQASLASTRDSPLNAQGGGDIWFGQSEKVELKSVRSGTPLAAREETAADACPDVYRSMATDLELIHASCDGAAAAVVERELDLLHARMRQSSSSVESAHRSSEANFFGPGSERQATSPQRLSESPRLAHSPQQRQQLEKSMQRKDREEDSSPRRSMLAASACLLSVLASLEEESLLQLGARAYAHLTDQLLAAAATPDAMNGESLSAETVARASKDSGTGPMRLSQQEVETLPPRKEEWLFPLPLAQHKDKLEARRAQEKSEALRRAAASKQEAFNRVMAKKTLQTKVPTLPVDDDDDDDGGGRLRERPQRCEQPQCDVARNAGSPMAAPLRVVASHAADDGRSFLENDGVKEEDTLRRSAGEVREPISPEEEEGRFGVINVPIYSSHHDHGAEAIEIAREKRRKQFEAGLRLRRLNPPSEMPPLNSQPPHRMPPRQGNAPAAAAGAHAANHQNVRNALSGVCLAGGVNSERLAEATDALSAHVSKHVVILLVEGQALSYRGLYAIQGSVPGSAELARIAGKGPRRLQEAAAEKLYKYSSARRAFIPLPGFSALASTTDAVALTPMAMKRLSARSPRP